MKKYTIIILLSFILPVTVTFNVDMQEQFVSENGIHLAGSDAETETFFGTVNDIDITPWTPSELTLLDEDFDGVYSISIELAPNTSYIYKFVNDKTWFEESHVENIIPLFYPIQKWFDLETKLEEKKQSYSVY